MINKEEIRSKGQKELDGISAGNERIKRWKSVLINYKFKDELPDDRYVWFTNVLALQSVDSGNFGVGCILIDLSGNVIIHGHNEVFNPYFRSDRHAEMVVMDRFEDTHRDLSDLAGFTLYTSLESCPMCLVRLITSGIKRIFHASPDVSGGMVSRMDYLPEFWTDLSGGKVFSQAACSMEMIDAANEIFLLNVDELIEKIKKLHS